MDIRERRKRFMMRWRSRQGPLTLYDLDKRDALLLSASQWLYRHGMTANIITLVGFIWTLVWIASFAITGFHNRLLHLFIFIIPIGLTDLFDGSTARNNDDVTPLGTLGDHFRDLLYMIFSGYLAFQYGFDGYLFSVAIAIECLILLFKGISFIWYGGGCTRERFLEFALDNFQHTEEDRWQSNLLYFGFPMYVVGSFYEIPFFPAVGNLLVMFSFGFGGAVLLKEWKWTPTPPEKERI